MLKGRYGNHDYSIYPDLTDYNITSMIEHKRPKDYEEFNKHAKRLQERMKYVHDFQERRRNRN